MKKSLWESLGGCRIPIIALASTFAPAVMAADIGFVGVQTGKDISRFGGAGHYVLAPGKDVASQPADEGELTGHGTVARKPEFLAGHPKVLADVKWVNFKGYADVIPAGGGNKLRIGGISSNMNDKGKVEGLETRAVKILSFKLSSNVKFRLGVMVDAFNERGAFAPDFVGIHEDGSGKTAFSRDVIVRDDTPDLLLFDIDGRAGVTYTLEMHRAVLAEGLPVTGLSALTFDVKTGDKKLPEVETTSAAIGGFQRAGEYFKDYYVYKEGDTFHLFYNVGNAGPVQDWKPAGNEKAFGHATSKDLRNWEHHPRILQVVPGTWEGMVVSALSAVTQSAPPDGHLLGFKVHHLRM